MSALEKTSSNFESLNRAAQIGGSIQDFVNGIELKQAFAMLACLAIGSILVGAEIIASAIRERP